MDGPIGRFRWWVCGLWFAATTLNYIDRQVLGVLAPDLGAATAYLVALAVIQTLVPRMEPAMLRGQI